MWLLLLAVQMIPPVEVAKEGWWMTEQGALSRQGEQAQVGDDLTEVVFWNASAGGSVGEPLIGDVDGDGDGEMEVVVFKHREVQVLNVPQQRVEWRFVPPDSAWIGDACIRNTGALGDVDGDGVVEIVAMEDSHRIWILDAARQAVDGMIQLPIFFPLASRCPKTPIYVADLEGDGVAGIVVGAQSPHFDQAVRIYYILPCVSRSGGTCEDSVVWYRGPFIDPTAIPFGDLDGNGTLEFTLAEGWDPSLHVIAYTPSGDTLWRAPYPNGVNMAEPLAIVDLDGDGEKEVMAVGIGRMEVYVLEGATGDLKYSYSGSTIWDSFADIDRDGEMEILSGTGFRTARALTSRGYVLWQVVLPVWTGSAFVNVKPLVGDFTPSPGLEVVYCTEPRGLYLLSSAGKLIWADTTRYTDPCHMAAGDVDNDGFTEIVVNSVSGGTYILDRPTDVEETRPEPGNDHGFRLIPGGFALRRSHPVTVFDLAGRKVFSGNVRTLFLPPGGYFVTLPETTVKVVVNK